MNIYLLLSSLINSPIPCKFAQTLFIKLFKVSKYLFITMANIQSKNRLKDLGWIFMDSILDTGIHYQLFSDCQSYCYYYCIPTM